MIYGVMTAFMMGGILADIGWRDGSDYQAAIILGFQLGSVMRQIDYLTNPS